MKSDIVIAFPQYKGTAGLWGFTERGFSVKGFLYIWLYSLIMKLFKSSHSNVPSVKEIKLEKDFPFMYENFVISSQSELFLLMEEDNDIIDVLCFNFKQYKYGFPNDEVGHPLMKYGLGIYGFFEVNNSEWIAEIIKQNSTHPGDSESLHFYLKHYIVKFKDVTLEVIARKYELKQFSRNELQAIIEDQLSFLKKDI